jgi:alpha-glucosidase
MFYMEQGIFSDPKNGRISRDGFKTVVIIDPELKSTRNTPFIEALEKDYFCKRADGPL